ncbi:hypothetical protein A9Q81_01250 [Gammaproteobacteria bacterium 42_54_T18]|nr:hypothetical protein A9Q81_01250 [Gammaproteobacteria bacterium 42_54_T18]
MADRPNENISKQVIKKIAEVKDTFTNNKTIGEFDLIQPPASAALVKLNSLRGSTPTGTPEHNTLITIENGFRSTFNQYELLFEYYKITTNSESVINRVETNAAWRNLLFRVGTTALVALTLGGAYSIAGNSDGLYLPLQQKTITYYYEGKHHPAPPADPTKYEEPEKVVTVTGSSKGKPLGISQPKTQLATGPTPQKP